MCSECVQNIEKKALRKENVFIMVSFFGGSTGIPKSVLFPHKKVRNMLWNFINQSNLEKTIAN